ncbi:MAG TPA: cytochrome c [Noviherbaspirillum sp.]
MRNLRNFGTILISALLAATGPFASANDLTAPKPLALRQIMKDLGKQMQSVTDGISREDWDTVEKAGALIADHPQPPAAEKVRILSYVGTDAGKFRGYDQKTHDTAVELQQHAQRRDGPAVIAAFANVQNACLGCHQSFRKPFMEHFYGKP